MNEHRCWPRKHAYFSGDECQACQSERISWPTVVVQAAWLLGTMVALLFLLFWWPT